MPPGLLRGIRERNYCMQKVNLTISFVVEVDENVHRQTFKGKQK